MSVRSFGNATATFYTEVESGSQSDAYGGTEATIDDEPVAENVTVRYEPKTSATTGFQVTESGDNVLSRNVVYAPLGVGDDISEGDVVAITHRGSTGRWRINEIASVDTLTGGYTKLVVKDYDD